MTYEQRAAISFSVLLVEAAGAVANRQQLVSREFGAECDRHSATLRQMLDREPGPGWEYHDLIKTNLQVER